MRTPSLAIALAALLVVGGCADDGSPGPDDLELELEVGAVVRILDFRFEPDEITVSAGQLIEFTNEGGEEHTVTADDDRLDTGELRPGETFSYDTGRDEPAAFEFHCEIHKRMRGRITIEAG